MKLFLFKITFLTLFFTIKTNDVLDSVEFDSVDLKSDNDNIFSTPDLSVDYTLNGETIHLDAYKTTNNENILSKNDSSLYGGLRWVSIGRPRIVQISDYVNQQQFALFHFVDERFSLFFTMLTDKDKQILQQQVRRVKNIDVDVSAFINLKANTIDCSVKFLDEKTQKIVILNGKVNDMISSPYEIKFPYFKNSPDRLAFEDRIKKLDTSYLDFECTITSGSTIKKTNTFTITLQQSNDIRLSDKIFGPSSEVYVTRDQLSELANEVNSYFNVVEDYQMPEDQFSIAFVESLITLAGDGAFNPVSFKDGLKMLSKYTLNFANDLNPDVITSELSNVFKVEKYDNKSRIIFDDKYFKELQDQYAASGSASASISIFGVGGGSASANFAENQSHYWLDKGSSLDDQLKELNSYVENQIQYEFQGNKIVPKSIKVSKMQSSSFKKTLSFSRIKNTYFEADFLKSFSLSTRRSVLVSEQIANLQTILTNRYPEYSIIMVGSNVINQYFDVTGKGFGKMLDWYICNGDNGTPDLRGRFIVGKDQRNGDYNTIGKTGGQAFVGLTIDHLPSHSHVDYGHTHNVDLNTGYSGDHAHEYKDAYFSEIKVNGVNDYVDVPSRAGMYGKSDYDNYGWQMSRYTYNNGNHYHHLNGDTRNSNANISPTGNNHEHENRPPYFVAQYIIFIPK